MTQNALQRRLVRLAAAMNAKAIRTGVPGRVTAAELAQIQIESEDECNYCGIALDPLGGTFDHVLSYAQGGANQKDNLVRSCNHCNRTKGFAKSPKELLEYGQLRVTCPVDGTIFRPRWSDWKRGLGKTCSRRCAGTLGGKA